MFDVDTGEEMSLNDQGANDEEVETDLLPEEEEVQEEVEAAPEKDAPLDLDTYLKNDVEMIVGHSRYQILEFWNTPDDPEGWATEVIDLIEIRQVVEFQRPLARRVMEQMPELPNKAIAYIRKHFNLWDVDLGR